MQDQEKPKYFECACHTPTHTIRFCTSLEEREVYLHTQLKQSSFLRRVKVAILYLLSPSKNEGWEETILNLKTAEELRDFLNDFLEQTKNVR